MDEIVHHCLRELAFDGDLGCNIHRLQAFINEFHATSSQHVDNYYKSFIWSLIVQQPTVIVGLLPSNATLEVYIPPRVRMQKNTKDQNDEMLENSPAVTLESIPEAKTSSLSELEAKYGDSLRVAVDPETSFAAITGSHIRPAKLTPMVYACLQLISRARENGISVVELGKKTGYDQKTCFYLVKQLVGLDLIIKLRRGGDSQNFCIHKYIFDRSPLWQQIREEESGLRNEQDNSMAGLSVEPSSTADDIESEYVPMVQFDPIDTRHLSSLPLIRSRLIKLLENTPDKMYPYNNLILAIGFQNPIRTDRRFFHTRLRALIAEGIFEKVLVKNNNQKGKGSTGRLCIRMANFQRENSELGNSAVIQTDDPGDEDGEDILDGEDLTNGLKTNVTVQKQLVDLLENCGTSGMTMNELSTGLGSFDKRTLELMLARMERNLPPSHLADLGVMHVIETYGRERRHRYFTIANYQALVLREGLEASVNADLSHAGEFSELDRKQFFGNLEEFAHYTNNFRSDGNDACRKVLSPSRKYFKNPILPNGTRKKGRPRKGITISKESRELNVVDDFALGSTSRVSGKRKHDDESDGERVDEKEVAGSAEATKLPKKRGRPKKKLRLDDALVAALNHDSDVAEDVISNDKEILTTPLGGENDGRGGEETITLSKKSLQQCSENTERSHLMETSDQFGDFENIDPAVIDARNNDLNNEIATSHMKRGRPRRESESHIRRANVKEGLDVDNECSGDMPLGSLDLSTVKRKRGRPKKKAHLDHSQERRGDIPSGGEFSRSQELTSVENAGVITDVLGSAVNDPGSTRSEVLSIRRSMRTRKHVVRVDYTAASESRISEASAVTSIEGNLQKSSDRTHISEATLRKDKDLVGTTRLYSPQLASQASDSLDPEVLPKQPGSPALSAFAALAEVSDQEAFNHADGIQHEKKLIIPNALSMTRNKPNISQRRRENELLRVIESMGGIVNTSSKDFIDAHVALLGAMTRVGEATSAPVGTRLDRRTLDTALNKLQSRNCIRLVTTSAKAPTGGVRPVKIAYLSDHDQTAVGEFLKKLDQVVPIPPLSVIKEVEAPYFYEKIVQIHKRLAQPDTASASQYALHAPIIENTHNGTVGENQMLRNKMLSEKQTVAQLYGFLVGRVIRARHLHLTTLKYLESPVDLSRVISIEQRVIDLDLYFHDICLKDYFSVLSALHADDELEQLLANEDGKLTRLKDLPETTRRRFQIGRSRSRARLFELLELLMSLGIVKALEESESYEADIICGDDNTSIRRFNYNLRNDKPSSSSPQFWQFCVTAPLYLWIISEDLPPFYKFIPVKSVSDGAIFWEELRAVCLDKEFAETLLSTEKLVDLEIYRVCDAAMTLRRNKSWQTSYIFAENQRQYLESFINFLTGETPIQHGDSGLSHLQTISYISCAPLNAVTSYYESSRERILRELERIKARKRRSDNEQVKSSLGQKIAEAEAQREVEWDRLVRVTSPEKLTGIAATRIERLRKKFVEGVPSKTAQDWLEEISEATKEAGKLSSTQKSLSNTRHVMPSDYVAQFVPKDDAERLLRSLVDQQIAFKALRGKHRTRTSKKPSERDCITAFSPNKPNSARHRFHWTYEYDELANDITAIVRARCGSLRFDWAAFDQVFPGVPRNSIRQRIVKLRQNPGHEAYLKRLEEQWHELWTQYRGTDLLPDDDIRSASNFNVLKHVAFLRKHIDKTALRVNLTPKKLDHEFAIPSNFSDFVSTWEISEPAYTPLWDFMWCAGSDESKEKQMMKDAFVSHTSFLCDQEDVTSEQIKLAEAALKMTLGTPNEYYNSEYASRLLRDIGEQASFEALNNLVRQGVISKLVRDPAKDLPGRKFKISEINQNTLNGVISGETFVDAIQLEETYLKDTRSWQDWSLIATEGDTAALLHLVSDHDVDFDFDTSHAQVSRSELEWNSKRAADDDVEIGIRIRTCGENVSGNEITSFQGTNEASPIIQHAYDLAEDIIHGMNIMGEPAACALLSEGVIDCQRCVQESKLFIFSKMLLHEERVASQLLDIIRDTGASGMSVQELLVERIYSSSITNNSHGGNGTEPLHGTIMKMLNAQIPLLFWAGYQSGRLISADYLSSWTVAISDDANTLTRIFPRRWLDIFGRRISDLWESGLKVVVGTVLMHPGISQTELRWRLRSLYDLQELNEILRYLTFEGHVIHRHPLQLSAACTETEICSAINENTIYWFVDPRKHWYRIESLDETAL